MTAVSLNCYKSLLLELFYIVSVQQY